LRADWSFDALEQFEETQAYWRHAKKNPDFARRIAETVANGLRRILDYPYSAPEDRSDPGTYTLAVRVTKERVFLLDYEIKEPGVILIINFWDCSQGDRPQR